MKPDYWQDAKTHLKKKDKVLSGIINQCKDPEHLRRSEHPFSSLLRAIAGQQLSVKAADTIWKRFADLFETDSPEALLALDDADIRAAGLSNQKTLYVKNIAGFFIDNHITDSYWQKPFTEIQADLLTIKGVGKWTTEMFGIFYLNEPDIFPDGDLGILKAVYHHYYKGQKKDIKTVLKLSEKWKPYRSVAAWYLWRSLDPVPIQY